MCCDFSGFYYNYWEYVYDRYLDYITMLPWDFWDQIVNFQYILPDSSLSTIFPMIKAFYFGYFSLRKNRRKPLNLC